MAPTCLTNSEAADGVDTAKDIALSVGGIGLTDVG